jgi:hypothetical protein
MRTQIYPFQQKIVIREELIHRYIIALDRDDTDTLTEILSIAKSDPILAKLIDEIEVVFAYS